MKINYNNYNITFQAKPGSKLLKSVKKEFHGDKERTRKFAGLFEDTFTNNTDKNTVIDINKNKNLIFSNNLFPDMKYCYKTTLSSDKSLAQSMLNECPKTMARGEVALFRHIISKLFLKDKNFDKIDKIVQSVNINPKFIENLSTAKKIIAENPTSELSSIEFDVMNMKTAEAELKEISTHIFSNDDFTIV